MPGTTKGALRIAIEDFLETSPLGKVFSKWFRNVSEDLEIATIDELDPFIKEVQKLDAFKGLLKVKYSKDGEPKSQGGLSTALGFGVSVGTGAASSLLAPLFRLLNYGMDKKLHSARLDPPAWWQLFFRSEGLANELKDHLAELGWSETQIKAWGVLSKQLLGARELIDAKRRSLILNDDYIRGMTSLGFTQSDSIIIEKISHVIPPVNDLISMAVREAWDNETAQRFGYDLEYPEQVESAAAMQGLDSEWTKRYWRAHWQLPSPQMGFEMLHRLRSNVSKVPFTEDDLKRLLKVADYPQFFRDRLIEISYSPLTRVDVRRMYRVGVLDREGVKQSYLDLGYNDKNAERLTEFTIRYETGNNTDKLEDYTNLTLTLAKQAYIKGLINREDYLERLSSLNYNQEDAQLIVHMAEMERQLKLTPDNIPSYQNTMINLVADAYGLKTIDSDTARSMLADLSLPDDQITYLLTVTDFEVNLKQQNNVIKLIGEAYISRAYDRSEVITLLSKMNIPASQQANIMIEFDIQRDYRSRRLTEAQYRLALKSKYITQEEYLENMRGLGYCDKDASLLLKLAEKG